MRLGITLLGIFLSASSLFAVTVTGNPAADGWSAGGNSQTLGTYVRGSGGQNFNVYFTEFTLDAGSPLLSANWLVGDQILGLGGVVQTLVDETARVVLKFGAADSTFSASPALNCGINTPPCGNASFSGGFGGTGSILVAFLYGRSSGNLNDPLWNGAFLAPDTQQRFNGSSAVALVGDYARIISLFDTPGVDELTSFQGVLNLSALVRGGVIQNPVFGANSIVTVQRSTNSTLFVDAVTGVPEPSTWAMAGAGLLIAAYRARKRGLPRQ
jgi:hypothetical protein